MVFGVSETIWSLRNPKMRFFYAKMTLTHDYPPLLTYLCDITQVANQGGDLHEFICFSKILFLISTF